MKIKEKKELSKELLGKRIKDLRKSAGYTNAEIWAYDHNIARAQYLRYESGQDLRFSSLVMIIDGFGISLEEFFSEGFEKLDK